MILCEPVAWSTLSRQWTFTDPPHCQQHTFPSSPSMSDPSHPQARQAYTP